LSPTNSCAAGHTFSDPPAPNLVTTAAPP
jgi:hypothetical protein